MVCTFVNAVQPTPTMNTRSLSGAMVTVTEKRTDHVRGQAADQPI
jgi:hypothetical protein